MKVFIFLFIIVLVFINKSFADAKYSELIELNKSNDPKKIIQLIDKLTLGFDIETSFIKDCASHLKIFKEKSNDKCKKVYDRGDSMMRLIEILGSKKFENNIISLATKIDNKSIDFISKIDLEEKLELLLKKNNEFNDATSTVTFLMKNL